MKYRCRGDGVILDGLLVQNNNKLSETVVLALVGHFQSEDKWHTHADYQVMFDSDVVFIDHRNLSIRADRWAQDQEELARDVIQFVKYFQRHGKQTVLYGMCGGAAQMILAANLLTKEKIPFKLVIDRFFSKYTNFFDIITITRWFVNSTNRGRLLLLMLMPFYAIIKALIKLNVLLAKANYNFAERIRALPENDVLILQAKSKRHADKPEPDYTDFFVHPKNDIRFALKDRRQLHKKILRNLSRNYFILIQKSF